MIQTQILVGVSVQVSKLYGKRAVALKIYRRTWIVIAEEFEIIILVEDRVGQRSHSESEQDAPKEKRCQQRAAAAQLGAVLVLLSVVELDIEAELVELS